MKVWKAAFLPTLLLPLLLAGCVTSYRGDSHESRYRLFFANKVPLTVTPANSVEEIASAFTPSDAVRQAITEIGEDGYGLVSIEPIKWGDGATIFTFTKKTSEFDRKEQRSPIHFTGVFKREGADRPTYYTFIQRKTGYSVNVAGDYGMKTFQAEWVARQLEWKDEQGHHSAQLSPDAQTLYIATESAEGFQQPRDRTVVTAERVVDHQVPNTPDERDARRYLRPLRQHSQRIYDPFPW